LETWFVQIAFLFPAIAGALGLLAIQVSGGTATQFPTIVHGHPLENLFLGIFSYLADAAIVPLALLLLSRTGQPPATLGLGRPRFRADWLPGTGLALAGFACVFGLALALSPIVASRSSFSFDLSTGNVPKYYVAYGIAISAITAVTEETLVNGYLLTRLDQLGWNPRRALLLSLVLRTSYHVYYGLGFLLIVPFGYLLTRSFQKHHRLTRPIVAHFLYDAALLTITVLAAT
jgi:membrane protease YdiL (CAAX protease family)